MNAQLHCVNVYRNHLLYALWTRWRSSGLWAGRSEHSLHMITRYKRKACLLEGCAPLARAAHASCSHCAGNISRLRVLRTREQSATKLCTLQHGHTVRTQTTIPAKMGCELRPLSCICYEILRRPGAGGPHAFAAYAVNCESVDIAACL